MKIKKRKFVLLVIAFIAIILTIYLILLNIIIVKTEYTAPGFPCKIVHLSDIHNYSNVDRVVKKVMKESPDIIMITGDIINLDDDDLSIAENYISSFANIAPTYVSLGNHEIEYEERTGVDVAGVFKKAGATVLDKEYVDIDVNGQSIRIGGIYGYCLPARYEKYNSDEVTFMRDFENTDSYKILMDHLPYSWSHYGFCQDYDIDLVLAGHTHGGQMRIPVVGEVYDPEFGCFPGKVSGCFEDNDTVIIVSRGLGNSDKRFQRINNYPEIITIQDTDKSI